MASLNVPVLILSNVLTLQNANWNCFAVNNNGVMVLNLNSVVPMKTHFAHGRWCFALHKHLTSLALMSVSKTTLLFNKSPANGFNFNSKFYLSPITSISLWIKIKGIKWFSVLPAVRSFHLEFLENCSLASHLCAHLIWNPLKLLIKRNFPVNFP